MSRQKKFSPDEEAQKKASFLSALKASKGIIQTACDACGITRAMFYRWRDGDSGFKAKYDEVNEGQIDKVESKLLRKIDDGDTTAIIFYLKTKGKSRGYSERTVDNGHQLAHVQQQNEAPKAQNANDGAKAIEKKVSSKKRYIIKLLKDNGKFAAEMTYQVEITARLLVRAEQQSEEMAAPDYKSITVEYSREGHERRAVNPLERLHAETLRQAQRALAALGMNTDSKQKLENADDSLQDFMDAFKDDDKDE
jgi:hypothetical protein